MRDLRYEVLMGGLLFPSALADPGGEQGVKFRLCRSAALQFILLDQWRYCIVPSFPSLLRVNNHYDLPIVI
jgi:hypothetical protein